MDTLDSPPPLPPAVYRRSIDEQVDRILAEGPQADDVVSHEQFAALSRLHRWHLALGQDLPAFGT